MTPMCLWSARRGGQPADPRFAGRLRQSQQTSMKVPRLLRVGFVVNDPRAAGIPPEMANEWQRSGELR